MSENADQLPQPASKPIVLIVDDSPLVHRLLKARLRDETIELRHAHSGAEALELVCTEDVATVLLDLSMPSMDGFEVLRALAAKDETVHVPVIVLSGQQDSQDKVMAFGLGAIDYITKPFDLAELRARMRSSLRIHRLVRMLSERAQLDGLTALWNRSHFDERLAQLVSSAERSNRPLSLALLDLDHFKSINDNYGHPAGDAALQGAAEILSSSARSSDVPCRYGGKEFAIILPETTAEQARTLCERIRESIADRHWPAHPDRKITVSIGIAGSEGSTGLPPDQWVAHADATLYKAKEAGRDRVMLTTLTKGGPKLAAAG
ncbi:MAG: diguanylate cyclase [Phycisphaerales bacterium]